jgi:uncharacterized DUF497 family protein
LLDHSASLSYTASMRFEWDKAKNIVNIQKHRIDFADVPAVFLGPMLVEPDEREDYGEQRWIGVGILGKAVVVVVFTERERNMVRIISARKANANERKKFEGHIKN